MGGTLRGRCRSVLRPFMLAAFLIFAWLVWAAGSASAASDDSGSPGKSSVSVRHEAATTLQAIQDLPVPVAAVPSPVSSAAAVAVDPVVPVLGDGVKAVTTAVVRSDSAPGNTLPDVLPDPLPEASVVDAVTGTVGSTVDAVTHTVNAVAGTVNTVVSVVDSLAPGLPDVEIPTVTVPTLPVPTPGIPTVPVPTVPVPTVPVPTVPVPTVPAPSPESVLPGRSPGAAVSPPALHALPTPASTRRDALAGGLQSAQRPTDASQQVRSVSPMEFLANTHGFHALAATITYIASAAPTPGSAPWTGDALRFAAVPNHSGSASAGAGSAGADAADIGGSWNAQHDARSALATDAAETGAAGPSFDPGSSPD